MTQTELAVAPVLPDRYEPVTGPVYIPETPAERASAFTLLERALQNSDMHMPGPPPFRLDVSFNASGNVSYTGAGKVTETWISRAGNSAPGIHQHPIYSWASLIQAKLAAEGVGA